VLRGPTNGVKVALDSSNAGIESLFGPVLTGQGAAGPVFAFHMLPITIFASLTSVLYYLGVLQFVVNGLGRRLYKALGTGGPESLGHLRHLPGSSRTFRAGPRGAS
jgi:CNT family concentrative nucleoside transporter